MLLIDLKLKHILVLTDDKKNKINYLAINMQRKTRLPGPTISMKTAIKSLTPNNMRITKYTPHFRHR